MICADATHVAAKPALPVAGVSPASVDWPDAEAPGWTPQAIGATPWCVPSSCQRVSPLPAGAVQRPDVPGLHGRGHARPPLQSVRAARLRCVAIRRNCQAYAGIGSPTVSLLRATPAIPSFTSLASRLRVHDCARASVGDQLSPFLPGNTRLSALSGKPATIAAAYESRN